MAQLAELAGLAVDKDANRIPGSQNEAVQVSAIKELVDRGCGKATQFTSGGLTIMLVKFT
jgi:hypothetical protein